MVRWVSSQERLREELFLQAMKDGAQMFAHPSTIAELRVRYPGEEIVDEIIANEYIPRGELYAVKMPKIIGKVIKKIDEYISNSGPS